MSVVYDCQIDADRSVYVCACYACDAARPAAGQLFVCDNEEKCKWDIN